MCANSNISQRGNEISVQNKDYRLSIFLFHLECINSKVFYSFEKSFRDFFILDTSALQQILIQCSKFYTKDLPFTFSLHCPSEAFPVSLLLKICVEIWTHILQTKVQLTTTSMQKKVVDNLPEKLNDEEQKFPHQKFKQ